MTNVTIIGAGHMGAAIAGLARRAGAGVQVLARDGGKAAAANPGGEAGVLGEAAISGDLVVLAVPFPALGELAASAGDQLAGKAVVDITNPVDFGTFDGLVVPADSSAAAELAKALPRSSVLKAFNTNFSAALASGTTGGQPTTVLVAGDDAEAKAALLAIVAGGGLQAVDAGSLRRARELEALGFLQMTLAATEKITWAGGFTLNR